MADSGVGGERAGHFTAGDHAGFNLEKNSISSIASRSNHQDSLDNQDSGFGANIRENEEILEEYLGLVGPRSTPQSEREEGNQSKINSIPSQILSDLSLNDPHYLQNINKVIAQRPDSNEIVRTENGNLEESSHRLGSLSGSRKPASCESPVGMYGVHTSLRNLSESLAEENSKQLRLGSGGKQEIRVRGSTEGLLLTDLNA